MPQKQFTVNYQVDLEKIQTYYGKPLYYSHDAFFFNSNIFDQIKSNAELNCCKQKLASFPFTPFKHSNFANGYGENKSLEPCLFCLVIDE